MTAAIRLRLFGAPTVVHGGRSLVLSSERRTQLVVYLALKRTWVGRGELAALLWPEQPAKLAYTNLRKALHRLQSLPWASGLEQQGSALRFAPPTDVEDFETALRERRLADAIALHREALLAGFDDAGNEAWSGWLDFERGRLQASWRSALRERLSGDLDGTELADLATRLVAADPLDDAAVLLAMTHLGRAGQVSQARKMYREFEARLAAELGLEPGAELKALHEALGSPATAGATAARAAIPPVDESFVGRTVELRRAVSLLAQDDCRLLTVTGPGGMGKTRLAQRMITECASSFADGAVFVSLDDLAAADELEGRLVRELDVGLKGAGRPIDQLIDSLRPRELLLVLDNFEQLVEAAPLVERLLTACPRMKMGVTSRVRLGLASEWLLPLEGLPCPEVEDRDNLETFDAARLFIRAARRVQPAFAPASEAGGIVDICQQVEGLPLALELAASWTRVLSCSAIADELRHGTELLQASDPTRPSRHASIEVVFEQSWHLLSDIEREVLARLSAFHGTFSPDAARAVARAPLPVLGALTDKSLLRREGARLRLHPLVQQLSRAKLGSADEVETIATAHARYFLRRLAEAWYRVNHAEREVLRELDDEFENVCAAWRHASKRGHADELRRAAYSLMSYCDHRGRRLEGLELLQEAMATERVDVPSKLTAPLAISASWLAYRLDRYADAEALAKRALDERPPEERASGDIVLGFQAATVLGAVCARTGRADEARRWLQQSLELARQGGDPSKVASALDNLGLILRTVGDLDEALRLYREALLRHREVGDAGGEATCLNNLSVLHIQRNETDAARRVLGEALQLCERHGLPSTRCMIEINLSNVSLDSGAFDQAALHARRAIELSEQTGQRAARADAYNVLAHAALRKGDLAAARAELAAGLSVAVAIARPSALVMGAWLLAEILAAQGARDVAARIVAFALVQPALVARERATAEQQLREWSEGGGPPGAWTGPSLEELAHRAIAEAPVAFASLIAELRQAA